MKDNEKCEEGNMKCNMENVSKGHIILGNQNNIWNVISKYHTTTDPTKHHMKIHTIRNPYHCSLFSKKNHLQEQHDESW